MGEASAAGRALRARVGAHLARLGDAAAAALPNEGGVHYYIVSSHPKVSQQVRERCRFSTP